MGVAHALSPSLLPAFPEYCLPSRLLSLNTPNFRSYRLKLGSSLLCAIEGGDAGDQPARIQRKGEGSMKLDVFEVVEPKFPAAFHQSKDVYDQMQTFSKSDREMLFIIFLNTKNRMLDYVVHTIGTVDSSALYPRDVIRSAIVHNSTAIIICHNHPSGDPEPSECDRNITGILVTACQVVGIRVLDHVIIGSGNYFSFADAGLIEDYKCNADGILRQGGINL